MADKSDDKNNNWRDKYLDALDQHDQLEKTFAAQQELLRRALVRVSVSADGQDDVLDTILSQLRERLRGALTGDISDLLAKLDEAALSFEQHRDHNAEEVRASLVNTVKPLQQLDLSRSVKKEISQYLAQLPQRSKKVRLYPALLQQLASIQQQALKEIEQPKMGLLQKILGGKNPPAKSHEKVEPASSDAFDTSSTSAETNANDLPSAVVSPSDAPVSHRYAEINAELNGASTSRQSVLAAQDSGVAANELSPEFIDKVTQIINQFLVGLENETPLAKKVHTIRARINEQMNADVFINTLETLRDLVMQAYLSANHAFASYLKNVNQELADIYSVVGGATESELTRRAASESMQTSMMTEMANLETHAETATDLAQLKSQVKSQIGNIRQALDHYQQAEQAQNYLASQLEALGNKIKVMEVEAEKSRAVLEKQRHKALHDPLTGLPNREYYNERANYEYQRWQRYDRPLTIAVFDIDHFKKINDTHGHQAGDKVLKVIGQSVVKRLREVDFFCRFGGEEFVALMPETNLEEALPVLDKIRAAIANAAFNYKEQPLAITLSVGATEFKKGDDVEAAFVRADEALYAAKSGGRNAVRSA